ncbi:MAG: exodeoxyribonuclease VII small subunit [Candidatus Adiutrix sp.]|jgi:exodeoxyribonuclease VII small subunit|nr:exodeoxyribonuclease VII small subunit [Candidatus Adiutrix sp.]
MKKKDIKFETGLARLEELVADLEDRGLSLDKALASFEEGLALSTLLRQKLDEAAGKVELLTRDAAGRPATQPFALDDDEDEEDEPDVIKF